MSKHRKPVRINVKALIILALVVVLLGGGAAVGYKVRKRIMSERALAAGKTAFQNENWNKACKQLRAYLSKYPDDEQVLVQYGEANMATRPQRVGPAIVAFRRLLRIRGPGDGETCRRLVDLYTRLGDFSEVAHVCRERRRVAPQDTYAALRLGQALLALREFEEARAVLEPLVADHPEQVKAYDLLSRRATQQRYTPAKGAAVAWLDAGVKANPRSAEARAQRARYRLVVMEDPAAALEDLTAADALDPQDPAVLLSLAEDWLALGRLAEARKALGALDGVDFARTDIWDIDMQAFALARFTAAGRLALTRPQTNVARTELAERALKELKGDHRIDFVPLAVRLCLADGSCEAARGIVDEYRKVVFKLGANEPYLRHRLTLLEAAITEAESRHHQTIGLLEPLVSTTVEFPVGWKMLGRAYSLVGQERRSLAAMEEYVRRVPDDAGVLMLLANAFLRVEPARAGWYAREAGRLMTEAPAGLDYPNWTMLDSKLLDIEAGITRALALKDQEKVAQFAAELAALSDAHPDLAGIHLLQARIARHEHRADDVIRYLEQAIARGKNKLVPSLNLAEYFSDQRRDEDAIKAYETAIAVRPDLALPRVSLYQFLVEKLGRRQEGRDVLEAAVEDLTGPEQLRAEIVLAQCVYLGGDEREGTDRLRQLAARHPSNTQLSLLLLKIPEINSDQDESQRLVDRLKSAEGDWSLRWRLEQAKLWLRADDWRQRSGAIEELLNYCRVADAGWRDAVLVLSALYEKLENSEKTEQTYRIWLESLPSDAFVVDRLLSLLERQERFAEASHLLEVTQDAAEVADAVLAPHRVHVAIGLREYKAAISELERIVAANPEDIGSRVTLARITSSFANDTDRAIALLDQAPAYTDKDRRVTIVETKAQILWQADRRADVLALLDSDVSKHGDFFSYLLRSKFLSAAGQFERAEADCTHLTTFEGMEAEGYRFLGLFYARHDRIQDAIRAFEAGLEHAGDNATLTTELARTCLSSQAESDRQRGRLLLDELLAKAPRDAALLLLRARDLMARETAAAKREAADILEDIILNNPGVVAAHLDLVQLARAAGDIEKASEVVTRGMGVSWNDPRLLLVKAEIELERDRPFLAREPAQQVLEREPNNVAALNLLARAALRVGDLPEAEAHNRKAIGLSPANSDACVTHAMILNARGRHDEAAQIRAVLLELQKAEFQPRVGPAGHPLLSDQLDAARKLLAEAMALKPADLVFLGKRARQLAAQSDFDGLAKLLAAILASHPTHTAIVLDGASLLAGMGKAEDLEQARSLVGRVVEEDPNAVVAHLTMARLACQANDFDSGIRAYRRVIELEPDNLVALNDLAWLLVEEKGDARAALALADRGLKRHPDQVHLLDTRGVILFRLNRLEEARADLEKSLQLLADSQGPAEQRRRAQGLFHLARVLAKLGQPALAREKLAIAKDVGSPVGAFSEAEKAEIEALLQSRTE